MKSITIKGSERESVGKVATKALRNAGAVPCVLYGGDQPVHFSAEEKAFKSLVYTPNAHTVVIELGNGKSFNAIMQDIQVHPVSDRILHLDFFQIFDEKEITIEVPVKIVGNSKGVMAGGDLRLNNRKLKVKALPANLPDFVEADITPLNMGNKLYVTQVPTPNFKIMHPDNTVICQVKISRAAMKAAQEAAKAAEVIIEEGLLAYLESERALDAVDSIRDYRQRMEAIRDEELERAIALLAKGGEVEMVMQRFARSLTNKMMHAPTVQLKKASALGDDESLALLQTMFDLNKTL